MISQLWIPPWFKTQIIITSSFLQEFEQISGNRRIQPRPPTSTPEELATTLQNYISGGKVAIHIQITDYDVNIIQQILIREIPATKFLKCTYFAQDIQTEEEAFRVVSIWHKEQKHPGITALYEDLKNKVYHKQLKIIINKITNNCDICNRAKYNWNPITFKFKKNRNTFQ